MKNDKRPYLQLPLLVVLLFHFCTAAFSQDIEFERIPNELGLSQNLISALHQDSQGFIWVGTKDGLNRFDGYRFQVFQHDPFDSTSISDNIVISILEDSNGRFWVGTANGLNLLDRQTASFLRYYPKGKIEADDPDIIENHPGLSDKAVRRLMEDSHGNIWAGTKTGEVIKIELSHEATNLDDARYTVFRLMQMGSSLWEDGVKTLAEDRTGTIWVHSRGNLSYIRPDGQDSSGYQIKQLAWKEFDPKWPNWQGDSTWVAAPGNEIDKRFYTIFNDEQQHIWVVSAGGFAKWLPDKNKFKLFPLDVNLDDYPTTPLEGAEGEGGFVDARGRIWLDGLRSLIVYDTTSNQLLARYHAKDESTPDFLQSGVQSLLEDANKNIWVGTDGKGLYKYSPHKKRFSGQADAKAFEMESIRSIYQTGDGTVWVGTSNIKLIRVNLQTGSKTPVILDEKKWPRQYREQFEQVFSMQEDPEGNLWVGGGRGISRLFQTPDENWDREHFRIYPDNWTIPDVFDLHFAPNGELWVLTNFEFGKFDRSTGEFDGRSYIATSGGEKEAGRTIPRIFQQNENTFWLCTADGLLKYDVPTGNFSHFTNEPDDPNSLSHRLVKYAYADPKEPQRILWVGTGGGGLNRFDLETGKFTHFTKKDGLPDDVIYSIFDDDAGHLWMSTNQGLSRFNPETGIFKNYSAKDGLQDNEFNSGAFFKGRDGRLFFGGIRGFNAFLPSAVEDNLYVPPIVITDFKLANQSVDFKAEGSPLRTAISQTEELVLTWKHNIFSFEFASLDYTEPGKNQYAYMLEGFDDEWQYIGTQRSATFTNIDPGEYTFRVKGTNHDGTWNEEGTSLKITILPPWWRSWWAYLGYVLLLGAAGYVFYKFQLNRRLTEAEAERLKEMDSLKTRLYTNITHEFRTPLTVIIGILDNIKGHENERKLISRNSKSLLRLVNQLLDLSKLDSGKMKLDLVQTDVVNYLQYLTESFHSMAEDKNLKLTFYSEEPELHMDCDEVKLQHVMYNLLSNAIKFTPSGGKIVVHLRPLPASPQGGGATTPPSPLGRAGEGLLQVIVQDNGIGIPAETLPHIFDRFYQVDSSTTRKGEGTGIGLALTKELVELMGGSISAKSKEAVGTDFTVLLPVRRSSELGGLSGELHTAKLPPLELPNDAPRTQNAQLKTQNSPILLIIEDNRDVVAYLVSILENDYQIMTAEDGQAGIEKALEHIPDVIISDVMMPRKDGFEVCRKLKTDERTSHIPIVLLTAKADDEAKITGLKTGADAYLMKPFNREELFVRLEKLIELRQALQERYANVASTDSTPSAVSTEAELTLDDIFMQKIHQTIQEQMERTDFGIEDLCKVVSLSSTQVYRKMKALTGESPVRFIQKMRLRKAKELLQSTELNISEIAYEVGFSDPNYFSRAFNKEFGMSPSNIRK